EKFTADGINVSVGDRGVLAQQVFDFLRRDVLAAANDDVLDAARDAHVTFRVHRRLIARPQPSILVNRRVRRFGVAVITLHHVVTAHTQLARFAGTDFFVSHRVNDLYLHFGQHAANGPGAIFNRVIARGLRDARRSFGQAVDDRDLAQVHFLNR